MNKYRIKGIIPGRFSWNLFLIRHGGKADISVA